jgi:oligopeptide transport system substrate-binding protein
MNAAMLHAFAPLLVLSVLACSKPAKRSPGSPGEPAQFGQPTAFSFARSEAHKNLDPAAQFDAASADIVRNLYDRLLDFGYLARPFRLEPNLATTAPTASPDGLRYGFELRDDAYFNDDPCFPGSKGRRVTVDDVIYSFQRFADANVNTLSYGLLQGVISGMDEFRAETQRLGKATDYAIHRIAGIVKQDERHFTLELTRPNPRALMPLAATQLSIVPREAVLHYKDEFAQHPVGSGPFFVETLSRRGVIALRKNPRYHMRYDSSGQVAGGSLGPSPTAGKRLPLVDRLLLPLIEEPQPRMLRFLSGQLDWVFFDRDTFRNMAVKDATGFHLKPEFGKQYRIYAEPDLRIDGLRFNMKDPLLGKNKALRQAIAYALDTAAFVDRMYNGRGEVLHSIVPLGIAGSERDVPSPGHRYDARKAEQKLAEAGYPAGRGLGPIRIDYRSSTSTSRGNFEFVRSQLARFGIEVVANYQTFSAYMQKVEAGHFQIIDFGWGADYPDAENFYQLLYSHNRPPGSNHGSYSNPEYDRLYEAIRFMPNGPERYALFARMNALVADEVPVALLWNVTRVGLYQPWVQNFKYHVLQEVPFKYLGIDAKRKAEATRGE